MDDDQILERGGTEKDIEEYAEQNGATADWYNSIKPLTKDELIKQKQRLNNRLTWIDHVIREYIGGRIGDMGLIDDEVRTPAFKVLKQERATIF